MGYALPTAIGACFASNNKRSVFAIVGDGGFHISLQSLGVIAQYKLPIIIIVLNNKSLGMIVQFQDLYFNGNQAATTKDSGYLVPDISAIAKAYKINYLSFNKKNIGQLAKITAQNAPLIIEIIMEEKTTVSPKLEVNDPLENMSPKINQTELTEIINNLKQ